MFKATSHNRFLCLVLLGMSLAASAMADAVVLLLKNGDHLTGQIASEDLSKVVLVTTWSTNVIVPLSAIAKREKVVLTPPSATITLAGDTNHPAGKPATTTVTTNGLPVKSVVTTTMSNGVVVAKIATNLPPITPKPPKRWNFDTQVGLNLQYNQKDNELFYGSFKANYSHEKFRQIIDFKGNYGKANFGKTNESVTANNLYLNYRDEYDITANKRAYLFNAAGVGEDQLRHIHVYYDESFGSGYKLIDRTNLVLSSDGGLNFQRQDLSGDIVKNSASLRLAESLTWKINPRLTFDEKIEFYPTVVSFNEFHLQPIVTYTTNFSQTPPIVTKHVAFPARPEVAHLGDYRARFEANISYKLNATGNIYCNLTAIDAYDTRPAAGITQNDLQIRITLGMKF